MIIDPEFAAALTLVVVGLVAIGIWIGLSMGFDRAQRAEGDDLWAQAAAREEARAARVTYLISPPMPTPDPEWVPAWYLPGYADPFPRPGRFAPEAGQLAGPEAPQLPHGFDSRPATSPVDLDEAVRLMCDETELYVAGLIARTRHAERNYA